MNTDPMPHEKYALYLVGCACMGEVAARMIAFWQLSPSKVVVIWMVCTMSAAWYVWLKKL